MQKNVTTNKPGASKVRVLMANSTVAGTVKQTAVAPVKSSLEWGGCSCWAQKG
jgi:hypothetical protein